MDARETLPPESIPVQLGEVLAGKYRVDRILGAGGMGVVVAATHLQLDQKVALKFMLPQALEHPALVERFAREARAAVRLKSDHVARVLDVGTLESGSPYMVMEYLEGSDIATIIETHGPMPVELAVDYVLQACDAVAEAHALGIIHRDLKPRNLFVTQRNDGRAQVKVLDFGISKQTGTNDLSLTRTTEIMGSPNYMSPEQLRSARAVDERSDIWALGVILYELLTGHVPFRAESVTQLTAMVLMEPPRPIASMRPDLPPALVRMVEHCLEKDPLKRFSGVSELAAALEPFAPVDMRPLAMRIARIAGGPGSRLPGPQSSPPGAKINIAGGTAVTWSGQTELATTSRTYTRKVLGIAVIGTLSGLLVGAVIFFGVVRRSHRSDATPAQTATTPPAAVASGAPASTNPGTQASTGATPAGTTPAAPTDSTAGPSPTTTATTTQKSTSPIGPGAARGRSDAGPSPSYEPPRNRTSW
jgi:serine/threonine protein kinase